MNDDLIMSNTDTDYSQALAEGWLPIREVSRITGVNAVTLRAWERRYGLIVPHRTAKGHRLFSTEHIQRIQQILLWLNRGVSVSQISRCSTRQLHWPRLLTATGRRGGKP